MQKVTVFALVFGAVIIASALFYHARQIALLSRQLEAVEKQNAALDYRLQQFSTDLPHLIEQGGRNAGRQAVHGVVEEVIERPLGWVSPTLVDGTSNVLRHIASSVTVAASATNRGESLIRFDISQPVVNIRLFPNLKELPDWPWHTFGSKDLPAIQTNSRPALPSDPADPQ